MLLSQSVGAPGHTVDIIITTMIHSFIHSGIYIAPLQGNYSEALPTPTRPKRTVLSLVRKVSGRLPGCRRSSRGRPFQIIGPATEKARLCIVAVRAKGTIRTPFSAERRRRRPGTTEIKQQSSRR